MALKNGDLVEELSFAKPDGSVITLATFADKRLLLIFLGHLA